MSLVDNKDLNLQTLYVKDIVEASPDAGVNIEGLNVTDQIVYAGDPIYGDGLYAKDDTYVTTTDIDYNGTTAVDTPLSLTLEAGTYLCGYCFSCDSTDNILTQIWVSDSTTTVVDESRCSVQSTAASNAMCVNRMFVATLTAETYTVRFNKLSGSVTTAAIDMAGAFSGYADPDQVPCFFAIKLSGTQYAVSYTGGVDQNRNGTTYVDVTNLSLTVPAGPYLAFANLCPTSSPSGTTTMVIRSGSSTVVSNTTKYISEVSGSITTMQALSLVSYIQAAASTTYKVSFVNTIANSDLFLDNDFQVPHFAMVPINSDKLQVARYSGAASVNFNGTTPVTLSGMSLELDPGKYLIGYNFPMRRYQTNTALLLYDGAGNIVSESKLFAYKSAGIGVYDAGKFFILTVTSSQTYTLRGLINSSSTTSLVTVGSSSAMIFSYKLSDDDAVTFANPVRFLPLTIEPVAPSIGEFYFDHVAQKLKVYTSGGWETVTSS